MINFFDLLNQVYHRLGDISRIEDYRPEEKLYQSELPHLKSTIITLREQIFQYIEQLKRFQREIEKLAELVASETGDDKSEASADYRKLVNQTYQHTMKINQRLNTIDSPYFGKITLDINGKQSTTYIGKETVIDPKSFRLLVSDWRAPLANVYYENSGPKNGIIVELPSGVVQGDLLEKKQFIIRNGRFNAIYDNKSGNKSADEFLEHHLNSRTGKELEDIIATIQEDQNRIIREEKDKPIVIQGVAGSGKTTIILHKIAYLVFKYKDIFAKDNILVLAPNQTFIEYVSNIIPNLGIVNTQINTFLFWSQQILRWDTKRYHIIEETNEDIQRFKGSEKYFLLIEELFNEFERELIQNINDPLKEQIYIRYQKIREEHPDLTLKERLYNAVDFTLQRHFLNRANTPANRANFNHRKKEILKGFDKLTDPYHIYKKLLTNAHRNSSLLKSIDPSLIPENWEATRKHILRKLRSESGKRTYTYSDLAPLLHIQTKLFNLQNFRNAMILVDEAQDLSYYQALILPYFVRSHNLIFAGDTAQSIRQPNFINDWHELTALLQKIHNYPDFTYHNLSKCYRTTKQIINFVNGKLSTTFAERFTIPEAIFREGEDVHHSKAETFADYLDQLRNILVEQADKDKAGTIAVIVKDRSEAENLADHLKQNYQDILPLPIIRPGGEKYQLGIYVISVAEAKGLEFDTVILADYTGEHYKTIDDEKLLYVALTRALHRMYFFEISQSILDKLI